jgi:hypothetical protein
MDKLRAIFWMLYLGLMLALIPPIWTVGPLIERDYFPVVSRLSFIEIKEVDEGSIVRFEYEKYRGACALEKVTWYLGIERRAEVAFFPLTDLPLTEDGISDRDSGSFVSAEFFVGLSESELTTNSMAITIHRCHPLWKTTSVFWKADSDAFVQSEQLYLNGSF